VRAEGGGGTAAEEALYLPYLSHVSPQEEAAREQRERASSSAGAREEALAEATGRAEGLEELLQARRWLASYHP
jgi:hypothetical protein